MIARHKPVVAALTLGLDVNSAIRKICGILTSISLPETARPLDNPAFLRAQSGLGHNVSPIHRVTLNSGIEYSKVAPVVSSCVNLFNFSDYLLWCSYVYLFKRSSMRED
ncbi:MAG: hypothetical protein OXC62_16160 [Aestuariivita sp.]|nr:hypothetical protein [Aestuariivita sp.]